MFAKRRSSILFSMLLAAAVSSPMTVQAQGEAPAQPPQNDPVAIYAAAGAGADQLQAIRSQAAEFEQGAKVRWQLLMNLQKQMHELSLKPDLNEKDALAKQDEINKAMAQMATERLKLMLKIRSVLTPEQKQKLVQLMQEREQKMREGRGGQGGPGGSGGTPSPPGG